MQPFLHAKIAIRLPDVQGKGGEGRNSLSLREPSLSASADHKASAATSARSLPASILRHAITPKS